MPLTKAGGSSDANGGHMENGKNRLIKLLLDKIEIFENKKDQKIVLFFEDFEKIKKTSKWEDEEAFLICSAKLKGEPDRFVRNHPDLKNNFDYEKLKNLLIERFERKKDLFREKIQFMQCAQKQGESIREFESRLRELGYQAKKEGKDQDHEKVLIEELEENMKAIFIQGLRQPIKNLVLCSHPETFKKAVDFAADFEETMKTDITNKTCNYCKKMGHLYAECRSRLREVKMGNYMKKPNNYQQNAAGPSSQNASNSFQNQNNNQGGYQKKQYQSNGYNKQNYKKNYPNQQNSQNQSKNQQNSQPSNQQGNKSNFALTQNQGFQ